MKNLIAIVSTVMMFSGAAAFAAPGQPQSQTPVTGSSASVSTWSTGKTSASCSTYVSGGTGQPTIINVNPLGNATIKYTGPAPTVNGQAPTQVRPVR